jgi:hypothetical protein
MDIEDYELVPLNGFSEIVGFDNSQLKPPEIMMDQFLNSDLFSYYLDSSLSRQNNNVYFSADCEEIASPGRQNIVYDSTEREETVMDNSKHLDDQVHQTNDDKGERQTASDRQYPVLPSFRQTFPQDSLSLQNPISSYQQSEQGTSFSQSQLSNITSSSSPSPWLIPSSPVPQIPNLLDRFFRHSNARRASCGPNAQYNDGIGDNMVSSFGSNPGSVHNFSELSDPPDRISRPVFSPVGYRQPSNQEAERSWNGTDADNQSLLQQLPFQQAQQLNQRGSSLGNNIHEQFNQESYFQGYGSPRVTTPQPSSFDWINSSVLNGSSSQYNHEVGSWVSSPNEYQGVRIFSNCVKDNYVSACTPSSFTSRLVRVPSIDLTGNYSNNTLFKRPAVSRHKPSNIIVPIDNGINEGKSQSRVNTSLQTPLRTSFLTPPARSFTPLMGNPIPGNSSDIPQSAALTPVHTPTSSAVPPVLSDPGAETRSAETIQQLRELVDNIDCDEDDRPQDRIGTPDDMAKSVSLYEQ